MIIINEPQNSEKWFEERKGVITSSRVKNILTDKVMNKTEIQAMLKKDFADETLANVESGELDEKEAKKLITAYGKEVAKFSQKELEAQVPRDIYEVNFYKSRPKEYWRMLAEMLGYEDDSMEDPRDRGHRLEPEAVEELEKEYGIVATEVGLCKREDYPEIGLSPDRLIAKDVIDVDEEGNILGTTVWLGGVEIKSPGVANHLEIIKTNEIPKEYWDQVLQYFVVAEVEFVYFVSYNPNVTATPLHVIKVNYEDVKRQVEESFENQVMTINHLKEDILSLSF